MQKTDIELLKSLVIKRETIKSNSNYYKLEHTAERLKVRVISLESNILKQKQYEGYNLLEGDTSYTNTDTDIKTSVDLQIWLNNTNLGSQDQAVGGAVISSTGRYYYTFTPNSDSIGILIKHSGSQQDLRKNFPVALKSGITYTISLDITGTNPNIVGGFSFKDVMIYEGTEEKPFEPFIGGQASPSKDFPQNIEGVAGEISGRVRTGNFIDFNTEVTKSGVKFTPTKDGILINGTITEGIPRVNIEIMNKTLKAGTYIINGLSEGSPSTYQLLIEINNVVTNYVTNRDVTLNLDEDSQVKLELYVYYEYGTFDNLLLPYKLERGIETTAYVERKSQLITLPLGNRTLYGKETIRDGIAYIKGKFKWALNWGKYVFTGNETISKNIPDIENTLYWTQPFRDFLVDVDFSFCNCLNYKRLIKINEQNKEGFCFNLYNNIKYLYLNIKTEENTAKSVKALLKEKYESGNPLTIVYPLEKTRYEDIEDEELLVVLNKLLNIKEYDNETYFEFDQDVVFEIEAETNRISTLEKELNINKALALEGGV